MGARAMNASRLTALFGSGLMTLALGLNALAADTGKISVDWRYQDARSGKWQASTATSALPARGEAGDSSRVSSEPGIEKTLFVVRVATELKASLKSYQSV